MAGDGPGDNRSTVKKARTGTKNPGRECLFPEGLAGRPGDSSSPDKRENRSHNMEVSFLPLAGNPGERSRHFSMVQFLILLNGSPEEKGLQDIYSDWETEF
jgi:hypothetical protein